MKQMSDQPDTDVHSSNRYKRWQEKFAGSSEPIPFLTLNVSVDGVQISQSSTKNLYPVHIYVNELPPFTRIKRILTPLINLHQDKSAIL